MATIELGDVSAGPELMAADSPAGRLRLPPRPVQVGALLILLLVTMAAAAVPPRPLPEVVLATGLGASAFTVGDRLIVADPVSLRAGNQWLSAYRLPDGAQLWRVRMPLSGNAGPATMAGGTLVMSAEWGTVIPSETVALDLATGTERWRRLAWLEGATETGDILLWTSQFGDWRRGEERPGTLRLVSADTGSERWSVPLPAGAVRTYRRQDGVHAGPGAAAIRQIVIGLPSGEIQIRDVRTGQVLRSARLPALQSGHPYLDLIGDLLLLGDDGGRGIVAYALDDFAPRWRITRRTSPYEWGPLPCAHLICFFGETGGVRALDPGTGRELWTLGRRWGGLLAEGDHLLAVTTEATESLARSLAVVDPATGAVVGTLGAWNVLGSTPDNGLLAIRPGPEERTWLVRLDPNSGEYRLLDRLREVSGDCQVGSGVLHCRRMDGSIGFWRLPY